MVVPVLITSCQVVEKLKNGPDTAQPNIIRRVIINAQALPVMIETLIANLRKSSLRFIVNNHFRHEEPNLAITTCF